MGSTSQPMQTRQPQAVAGIPLEGLPSDRNYSGMRVMKSRCGGMLRTSLRIMAWNAVHQLPLRGDISLTIHCKTWHVFH